ncbi:integrase arm-type DNA-binding domain-containing protein [Roseomonas sp. SG15]|uniref:Integrase arm-type DNA-binding domain-containing protein n=1 Tax=Roseomonas indoligenes TaxID=2820811 RepID=A0A940S491_9PROT|nr:integrase arm-type DNA-binding domain-containing protein [Pararoseomonas indoligenes]MBP0493061.1 integrase arm-type DNA-binding domain-containing protein [Pararoseomonas indoligenes]
MTDKEVRAAEKRPKAYRLADGQGLHLQVEPNGSKLWRYRYEVPTPTGRKEKMLALGRYPAVGLRAARDARDAARRMLADGKDPGVEKRVARAVETHAAAATFEEFGRAWYEREAAHWVPLHRTYALASLENDVFPAIGKLPINRITPPMVLELLRKVEARGAVSIAHRVRQRISAIFVFAIAAGVGENDPAAVVAKALRKKPNGRQPAATSLAEAQGVLRAVEAQGAQAVTFLAHRFLALTAVRHNEMTRMDWAELEGLDGPEPFWRIPKERMKGEQDDRHEHLVPLSRQAVEILAAVARVNGRRGKVFRHAWKPAEGMSKDTIGKLLAKSGQGGKHVPHGWRSAFSTIMNERHPNRHDREVIDLMLAHRHGNKVEAAYNRAAYMPRRRELAQDWADLLLNGMPGTEGVPGIQAISQPPRPALAGAASAGCGAAHASRQ